MCQERDVRLIFSQLEVKMNLRQTHRGYVFFYFLEVCQSYGQFSEDKEKKDESVKTGCHGCQEQA